MPTPLKIPKSITVHLDGEAPAGPLQPGETTLPLATWHGLGSNAAVTDALGDGRLRVVHKRHEFQDGDDHCIGCTVTRGEAEAERRAKQPRKPEPAPAKP